MILCFNKHLKVLIFLFILPSICLASWAIGGEMTYECLGDGDSQNSRIYRISLTYYIECNSPIGGESFSIDLYRGNELLLPYPNVSLDTLIVQETPEFPCLIAPEFPCVERRIYSTEIELPVSDSSYFFAFQTCCRNTELSNINFSDLLAWGYSMFIEITPFAQQEYNSSPTFQELPPSIICKDETTEFENFAFDIDGDQLVYGLYAPFIRINNGTSTLYSPPPYPPVNFIFPEFRFLDPLGINATFDIDAGTGYLRMIPDQVGQFIIGITVSEYRNGQLLSTVYRDFQQNVIQCQREVVANLEADSITNDGTFIFNVCNSDIVEINNLSTDTNFIDEFKWLFNIGNDVIEYNDWNLAVSFPTDGSFTGQLSLNANAECSDTANVIVNVSKELIAGFMTDYDTCVGGPVEFYNESRSSGTEIKEWLWDFGDGNSIEQENVFHRYEDPGEFNASLKITNIFSCTDSVQTLINWQPAPPIIVISPDYSEGCVPLLTTFTNLSSPIDSNYQIYWEFGDNNFSSEFIPTHSYIEEGVYPLSVSITSPLGCYIDTVFHDLIKVESPPIANFQWSPDIVTGFDPVVSLNSTSERDIGWEWNINNQDVFFQENFEYVFADTGFQQISLLVEDQYGCQDSVLKIIDVVPGVSYFLPNAFTPNQDGNNEEFKGVGVFDGIKDFKLSIFDRWGQMVFSTIDINQGWDGRNFETGKEFSSGVYVCLVTFMEPRGNLKNIRKSIVLVR